MISFFTMKKIILLLMTLAIFLCACNEKSTQSNITFSTLDLTVTTNWGIEAIDYTTFDAENIKIAVIDRIGYIDAPGITYHSVVDNDNNPIEHGSYVVALLHELVPSAEIVAINIATVEGLIEPLMLAEGIQYAIDSGCHVINISLGSQTNYTEVEEQILDAVKSQCVVVAACGNESRSTLDFPAGYDKVISVMARNIDNIDFDNNNISNNKKSISAPGSVIFNETRTVSGSSIAAAYVTAEVAYILSIQPDIALNELQELLIRSSIFETEYSFGMINHQLIMNYIKE